MRASFLPYFLSLFYVAHLSTFQVAGENLLIQHVGGQLQKHIGTDVTHSFKSGAGEHHDGPFFLTQAVEALKVMQAHYYELWIGTWPSSIDWTGAVINTHVSALLGSLARYNHDRGPIKSSELIHQYFAHNIAYYFGEEAFSIRNEAFDDMLWVVLGWLETVKFIDDRNATDALWHGTQFIPAFAHRARIFWDLASRGWDTEICGGGMIWNPYLTPYKNAITNQLFISASVSMYLYFPGDNNDYPFMSSSANSTPGRAYDSKYLDAAIEGYAWLRNSNMTNMQGLYVDGYHVTDWGLNGTIGTGKCDERNEVVYTYNQGVILSGLRGLWEATGNETYLNDGYELIQNVIRATGWSDLNPGKISSWAGLGQNGVLEELCDRSGSCSQDSQTFKGIFFQHLTQFCTPLPLEAAVPGRTHSADKALAVLHETNCLVIGAWVRHNAKAALQSRNSEGLFGTWWGQTSSDSEHVSLPRGAEDYRNNATIMSSRRWNASLPKLHADVQQPAAARADKLETFGSATPMKRPRARASSFPRHVRSEDTNDRGRGRTVETQSGGLAVLRAAWEMTIPRRLR